MSFLCNCSDRGGQELQSLLSTPRVSEKREIFFEDRTKCHADHVDQGLEQQTTAAVGMLKAVHFDGTFGGNRCVCVCVCVYIYVCLCTWGT